MPEHQEPIKIVNSETQELEDVVLEDPAEAPTVHTLGKLEDVVSGSSDINEDAKDDHQARKNGSESDADMEKASLDLTIAHESAPEQDDHHRVSFDNPYHPTRWGPMRRWSILTIYWRVTITLQVFVTLMSTEYISLEYLIKQRWPASSQVLTLGQSGFILGTAIGPAFLGPASDMLGRKWLYVGSTVAFVLVNFGVAFPKNLPMLIIFMVLSGVTASVALANTAATVSDLFGDDANAGQAMALFVSSANFGPSLGAPIGQLLVENENMGLKWMGLLNIIIGAVFCVGLSFVPETLPKLVIRDAAIAAGFPEPKSDKPKPTVVSETVSVVRHAMKLMFTEPIIIALAFVNGFSFALIFLQLDGVFETFVDNKGLTYLQANLTFLNISVGCIIMFCFLIPIQTKLILKDRVKRGIRPEARFLMSLPLVWLFPISLFWFAWTSGKTVSYWSPLIAGVVLGAVNPLLWCSMMSYCTDCFTDCAASAIVSLLIPSFVIAAVCSHFGVFLFEELETSIAGSILAALSIVVSILIYCLYFFGPRLRKSSRYARKF